LSKSKPRLSEHYISFIDIMFGVMVAESFASFKSELFAPSFDLFVLLLSYFTILTSWLFYHRSVKIRPEVKPWRFAVDVTILFLYFVLINTHKDFSIIVLSYPILWGLYLVWDWLKSVEIGNRPLPVFWSAPYLLVFVTLAVFHFMIANAYPLLFEWMKWVELGLLFVTVLTYRMKQPTP